ncbi:MAG: sugar ABC transporter ATP-binding protein [Planctomycetota bacterium]
MDTLSEEHHTLLSINSLCKVYSSPVVDSVSIAFAKGEIHALLGANGAGKSTLCKIIAGLVQPTSGTMKLANERFEPRSKSQAESAGIQIVQQELNLIPTLDVAQNLFLHRLPSRWGILQIKQMHSKARALLDAFGLQRIDTHELVGNLGIGQQQMLEIASNMHRTCRLLILDEPTAALSSPESELLFEKLVRAKEEGLAIIYISHRLDEVERLADRISILRDGKRMGTWERGEMDQNQMVEQMTGDENSEVLSGPSPIRTESTDRQPLDRPVLSIRGFVREPYVRGVDLDVNEGMILGIAGLVGSGRTELLRLMYGADRATGGSLCFADGSVRGPFHSPQAAVKAGIVLVSEDRKADGLLLNQSIEDNIFLPSFAGIWQNERFSLPTNRWGGYSSSKGRAVASDICEPLDVRYESVEQLVGTLSGGNQQKVVIAKWLLRGGNIYLFDEPTRGIDVAARGIVHRVLRNLAAQGKGLVVVSSDLEELIEIADRIAVMSNGRITGRFQGADFPRGDILQAMFAGYQSNKNENDGVEV